MTPKKHQLRSKVRPCLWLLLIIPISAFLIWFFAAKPSNKLPYHVTLFAPDSLSHNEYVASKTVLKGRIDILMRGKNYKLKETGNQIELFLPEDAFGEENPDDVLKTYITGAVKLYLVRYNNLEISDNESDYIYIPREDIHKISLHDGPIPFIDDEMNQNSSNRYIVVTFSDSFISQYGEKHNSWETWMLLQDVSEEFHPYGWELHPTGTKGTYYILNDDKGEQFTELLAYNLSHDSLQSHLLYTIDSEGLYDWEIVNDQTRQIAPNQCNVNDFTEHTIAFILKASGSPISDETLQAYIDVIRTRMNSIGVRFAIGIHHNDNEEETLFMIKTNESPLISEELLYLIGEKRCSARLRLRDCYTSIDISKIDLSSDEQIMVEFDVDDYRIHDIEVLNQVTDDTGDEAVLFIDYSIPLLKISDLQMLKETKTIVSNDICDIKDGVVVSVPITVDNQWMISLMKAIFETNGVMESSLIPQVNSFMTDRTPLEGLRQTTSMRDSMLTCSVENIEKTVKSIRPEADVQYTPGTLQIFLHLSVDEWFAERSVNYVKQIYNAIDPENMYVDWLRFILLDEDSWFSNKARIIFSRKTDLILGENVFDIEQKMDGFSYDIIWYGSSVEEQLSNINNHMEKAGFKRR